MLFSGLRSLLLSGPSAVLTTHPVRYAARRGTRIKRQLENRKRARARAAAAKLEPPKKWIPPHLRMRLEQNTVVVGSHFQKDAMLKPPPPDNAYFTKGFFPISYEIQQAIDILKETHGPDMWDEPDAVVVAVMEMDMRTVKKTKFVPPFTGLITEFKHDLKLNVKRSIAAVVTDLKEQDRALTAGASIVGSNDLIKDILKGRVRLEEFDEIVVQTDMLIPLAPLRGILKHKFPTKSKGNYGPDVVPIIQKFVSGVGYECTRDDFDPAFGLLELPFGRISMSHEQLIANLNIGLQKIEEDHRTTPDPKAADFAGFFRKVYLRSVSECQERLQIKHWLLDSLSKLNYVDPLTVITAQVEEQMEKEKKEIKLLNVWQE